MSTVLEPTEKVLSRCLTNKTQIFLAHFNLKKVGGGRGWKVFKGQFLLFVCIVSKIYLHFYIHLSVGKVQLPEDFFSRI